MKRLIVGFLLVLLQPACAEKATEESELSGSGCGDFVGGCGGRVYPAQGALNGQGVVRVTAKYGRYIDKLEWVVEDGRPGHSFRSAGGNSRNVQEAEQLLIEDEVLLGLDVQTRNNIVSGLRLLIGAPDGKRMAIIGNFSGDHFFQRLLSEGQFIADFQVRSGNYLDAIRPVWKNFGEVQAKSDFVPSLGIEMRFRNHSGDNRGFRLKAGSKDGTGHRLLEGRRAPWSAPNTYRTVLKPPFPQTVTFSLVTLHGTEIIHSRRELPLNCRSRNPKFQIYAEVVNTGFDARYQVSGTCVGADER